MELNDENAERVVEVAAKITSLITLCQALGFFDDIDILREAARG